MCVDNIQGLGQLDSGGWQSLCKVAIANCDLTRHNLFKRSLSCAHGGATLYAHQCLLQRWWWQC